MTNLQRMLCGLFCVLVVQPASAELIKTKGESSFSTWVECLNDTITLDYEYNLNYSLVEKDNMTVSVRSVRQSGEATDSYANTWKFNGHYRKTSHDLIAGDTYKAHVTLLSHDVLVGQPGGPGNLLFTVMRKFVWFDGEYVLESVESEVTCVR
jgi:hypothetical protein